MEMLASTLHHPILGVCCSRHNLKEFFWISKCGKEPYYVAVQLSAALHTSLTLNRCLHAPMVQRLVLYRYHLRRGMTTYNRKVVSHGGTGFEYVADLLKRDFNGSDTWYTHRWSPT